MQCDRIGSVVGIEKIHDLRQIGKALWRQVLPGNAADARNIAAALEILESGLLN